MYSSVTKHEKCYERRSTVCKCRPTSAWWELWSDSATPQPTKRHTLSRQIHMLTARLPHMLQPWHVYTFNTRIGTVPNSNGGGNGGRRPHWLKMTTRLIHCLLPFSHFNISGSATSYVYCNLHMFFLRFFRFLIRLRNDLCVGWDLKH